MTTAAVLAASTGAGYYAMQSGMIGSDDGDAHGSQAAEAESKGKFIEIDPLVIPLVEDDRILHHVYLTLSLEVAGKGDVPPVLAKKFRLHHTFLMALYDRPIQKSGQPTVLDREKVRSIVKAEANQLLDENLVQGVRIDEAFHGNS